MKLFFAIVFIFSLSAQSFFERNLSAAVGTNPLGLNFSGGLAYNYKIWDNSEKLFWNYGYIRPKIEYNSSIAINTFSSELQIYPISIFGFSVGSSYSYRNVKKLDDYDCDQVNCKGQLGRNYFKVNLNLGYSKFSSAFVYQKSFFRATDGDQDWVEFNSMLVLPTSRVTLEKKVAYLGYKYSDQLDFGLLEMHHQISDSKSEGQFFVTSYKAEAHKWIVGIGTFGTDQYEKSLATFVKVSWLLDPSLSLND